MSIFKQFSRNLIALIRNDQNAEIPAFLGNLTGSVKADALGNVYVTLFNGEVRTVYNGKVPNVPRLPVVIGYGGTEKMQVLRSRDVFPTAQYPDIPNHGSMHTFPGPDAVPIRGEQFLPGLVIPYSGLTVKIYSLPYELADGWHVLATQTLDLTSSVPSTGAKYARLEADDTGAVTISLGTAVDARGELEYSDIPDADPDKFSLAAVKLYAGQTSLIYLPTDTDIIDLRFGKFGNIGYFDTLYVGLTGNQTIAGVKTFTSNPIIPDEAYDATAWNGSMEPPTKNAVRDKIESMSSGGGTWGSITGTLSDQTDLQTALDGKLDDSQLEDAINNGVTTKAPSQNAVFDALALKANDADVVHDTGDETIAGVKTFSSAPLIPDEAYDATAWNGSLEPPTKNAVRDKMETKEDTANKATTIVGNEVDTTKYPSTSAIYDFALKRDSNFQVAIGEQVSLADDATYSFTPPADYGMILVQSRSAASTNFVLGFYVKTSGGSVTSYVIGSNTELLTGVMPSPTAGTDGKLCVSVDTSGGVIYIRNRTGSTRNIVIKCW